MLHKQGYYIKPNKINMKILYEIYTYKRKRSQKHFPYSYLVLVFVIHATIQENG